MSADETTLALLLGVIWLLALACAWTVRFGASAALRALPRLLRRAWTAGKRRWW